MDMLPTGIVTFLFTDIEGSTPLWEQMPAEMQAAVAQHHAILRQAIEANNGQVFQILGDAFQAAFRLPVDGLRAAVEIQRALQSAAWGKTGRIQVRIGLHAGPAELDPNPGPAGYREYAVSHTLNRSGRVMSAGHGGQILLSQEAADLVERSLPEGVSLRDMGLHRLKGMQRMEHLFQVIAPGLLSDFPPLSTSITRPNNLPLPLTSFIGREREIETVIELLRGYRLVTLHGSGGTGKTRLGLEAAARLLDIFEHGAWLVDLAPLSDPGLIEASVAAALGLRELPGQPIHQALSDYLSQKKLLLVLDNCEHLVEACARLAEDILRSAPGVRILATSREALGIGGEATYRVPSLSLPEQPSLSALEASEAGRLFADRAAAVLPGFRLSPSNAGAVAQICARLDGIALAIELAASRARALTVDQIAARLSDRFRVLSGGSRTALPRHQTLRAVIDWSYDLLVSPEQALLRRLAVFAGGWTLEAAESVCGDADASLDGCLVMDCLSSLVNKSLALMETPEDGEARYQLLETVRQYALEKLYEAREADLLRGRHLEYFAGWVGQAASRVNGPEQKLWLLRCDQEVDNLRAALEWGAETDRLLGLRLAMAAGRYFARRNHTLEAQRWLALYLDPPGVDYPPELHVQALAQASTYMVYTNADQARQYAQRSIDLAGKTTPVPARACLTLARVEIASSSVDWMDQAWRLAVEQGDREMQGSIMEWRGWHAIRTGDFTTARQNFQEMVAIFQSEGDVGSVAYGRHWLGWLEGSNGNLAEGRRMLDEAMRTIKELWGSHHSTNPGALALEQGDYAAAEASFLEYLDTCREAGIKVGIADGVCLLAMVAWSQGDLLKAEALLDEAQKAFEDAGGPEDDPYEINDEINACRGLISTWTGEYEQAEKYFARLTAETNSVFHYDYLLYQAELALRQGRLDRAADLLHRLLPKNTGMKGVRLLLNQVIESFADLYCRRGKPETGARLLGAGDAFRAWAGRPQPPLCQPYYDDLREQLRRSLGPAEFEAAYRAGQSLSLEEAAELIDA